MQQEYNKLIHRNTEKNVAIFFILEKVKEASLYFSQGTGALL